MLGGIQINGPTEGPELLAIRHFELRAPDGTLTDKMAALERALDLQVNGFNRRRRPLRTVPTNHPVKTLERGSRRHTLSRRCCRLT